MRGAILLGGSVLVLAALASLQTGDRHDVQNAGSFSLPETRDGEQPIISAAGTRLRGGSDGANTLNREATFSCHPGP
jgi:hypothetical protein